MVTKDKKKTKRTAEEQVRPDLSNPFGGDISMTSGDPLAALFGGGQRQVAPANDQTEFLRGLMDLWRTQQIRPAEAYEAEARAANPMQFEQQQYQARQAADPWGPGGLFAGRGAADRFTPEEIVASQGRTAENQILANRQKKTDQFNPEELRRLNQVYAANRTYS